MKIQWIVRWGITGLRHSTRAYESRRVACDVLEQIEYVTTGYVEAHWWESVDRTSPRASRTTTEGYWFELERVEV